MTSDNPNDKPSFIEFVAQILRCEFDATVVPGFGLDLPAADIAQRQEALQVELMRLLSDRVPEGEKIVLCGPGMGQLALRLNAQGFECAHVAIDKLDVLRSQQLDGQQAYAGLIIEGTVRRQDQLSALQIGRSLVREGGCLILAGEYLAPLQERGIDDVPNLSSCLQLAERLGFKLSKQDDYSAAAIVSLQELQQLADKHRKQLEPELEKIGWTHEAGKEYSRTLLQAFESGQRTFQVLAFEHCGLPDKEFSRAEFGGIDSYGVEEIAELFSASFGVEFNAALWRWKYLTGKGRCVLARQYPQGPIIAHYGGAPRTIHYFGAMDIAIQVCDVMVMPGERRRYGQQSLFFKTATTFLEREIGYNVDHLLGFGFPNQKAMNIAKRLGLYQKTDDFVEIIYPVAEEETASLALEAVELEDSQSQSDLQSVWETMHPDFTAAIVGVRDVEYMQYRYFQHPHAEKYQCYRVTNIAGDLVAFVVLKKHNDNWLIMDLICPVKAMPTVLQGLREWASAQQGKPVMMLWITRGWLDTVLLDGAIVNELNIEIPCNDWNPGPDADILQGAWWLTAGDMDFM